MTAFATLVLGGARSGKSRHAEGLAQGGAVRGGPVMYLATAQALDGEMADRIAHHAARRGPHWTTVEEPLDLTAALISHMAPGRPILVDCLTLWISNLMFAGRDVMAETEKLCRVLANPVGPVILVSNEVGMGLVPETPLGRAFRDHQGLVNQQVAQACKKVVFVAAGLPLVLKDDA